LLLGVPNKSVDGTVALGASAGGATVGGATAGTLVGGAMGGFIGGAKGTLVAGAFGTLFAGAFGALFAGAFGALFAGAFGALSRSAGLFNGAGELSRGVGDGWFGIERAGGCTELDGGDAGTLSCVCGRRSTSGRFVSERSTEGGLA
jgi:hypothetical protein